MTISFLERSNTQDVPSSKQTGDVQAELEGAIDWQEFCAQNPELIEAANTFIGNRQRLEMLERAADADVRCLDQYSEKQKKHLLRFHNLFGASISNGRDSQGETKTFWNNDGFFVDKEGTIYNIRRTDPSQSDARGEPFGLVLVSGGYKEFYERMPQEHCVGPYVYDTAFVSDEGSSVIGRIDFVNKDKGAPLPPADGEGGFPAHIEGTDWVENRNSIRILRDKHNGEIIAELHIPARKDHGEEVTRLYTAAEVLATVRIMDAPRQERIATIRARLATSAPRLVGHNDGVVDYLTNLDQ